MFENLIFCENCRNKVDEINQLQFVEEDSDRGFCSESCIMEFYRPFLKQFEIEEIAMRKNLSIEDEPNYSKILGDKKILDNILNNPTEIWLGANDLGKQYYTHILALKEGGKDLFFIAICSYIENGPSFIFYRIITEHISLLNHYKRDIQFESNELNISTSNENDISMEEHEVPTEIIELLDSKKSSFLAEMMIHRKENDIEFEKFHLYDKYINLTLEQADEIYEFEDDEGDILNTYIKSFQIDGMGFYYVVICLPFSVSEKDKQAFLPILSFPSIDNDLYPIYAKGEMLNKKLKN